MLTNAVFLAGLSIAGAFFVFRKLPDRIQRWFVRHPLFTDFTSLICIYFMFGGGPTALLAASMSGLIISLMLEVATHPDKYLFLYAARDKISEQLSGVKGVIETINETYKARLERQKVINIS